MGIRSKIKSRLKQKLGQLKVLAAVVQDEANHPGRPQPHMAARNPFWGGDENLGRGETEDQQQEEADLEVSTEKSSEAATNKGSLEEEEADFWFLKYEDNEGWNETNPGKKK